MDYLGYYALISIALMMFMFGYVVYRTGFAKNRVPIKRIKPLALPILFFSPFVFVVVLFVLLIEIQPWQIEIYRK